MPQDPEHGFGPFGEDDTFIGRLGGIEIRHCGDRTETRLLLEKQHTNPMGTAHGGVLMTLLDITLGSTAAAHLGHAGAGHPATIQMSCSLMAAAKQGDRLWGEARVESATRTMSFVSGRLHVDGRTIVTASAVFRNPPAAESRK